jgi:UDPglucose 6-dehydrogenase
VEEAVRGARVVFICAGRPSDATGDRSLAAVEDAAREIARNAEPQAVLVVKSTVPPGTTGRIAQVARLERPTLDLIAVSNPEFLREGHAIEDTLRPDRIVVGSDDPRGHAVLRELYAPLLSATQLMETDPRTAELSKLSSNAFLATKISFANALARIAELADADVDRVTEIMGADPRIGPAFLRAGMGYGGYCLPKDVTTLQRLAGRLGYDFGLLRETARINDDALAAVVEQIEDVVWNLEGKVVTLFGLAFKAGTDDVRGAPAMALGETLHRAGVRVRGSDPRATDVAARAASWLEVEPDPYRAADGAHCVVVCTEWPEYRELDLAALRQRMAQPAIVDARNTLSAADVEAAGFLYLGVGARVSSMLRRDAMV